MKHAGPGFLLIELMVLILLVTLLITLFIGGQAQLLKIEQIATKKLQNLNILLNAYEKSQGGDTGSSPAIQGEKFTITRPTVTDSAGNHEKWTPSLVCLARSTKPEDNKVQVWLPGIVFP